MIIKHTKNNNCKPGLQGFGFHIADKLTYRSKKGGTGISSATLKFINLRLIVVYNHFI